MGLCKAILVSKSSHAATCRMRGQGEDERHLRQLMDLMHQEDSCSDEEGDGSARLMALAAQVATQGGQLQPVSQQVWPFRHRAAACMR